MESIQKIIDLVKLAALSNVASGASCRASPWRGHASQRRARRPNHTARRCIAVEESEIEQRKARMFNEILAEKDEVSRKDALELMMINYGYATASCYKLLKDWIAERKVEYIDSSKSYKKQ